MSEFAFELALCAALEERRDGIIARQLGGSVADPGGRILDVVCVEPGPAFDERRRLTGETIPDAAVRSAVGPGRFRYWKDAFDCHPDRARRATERAVEVGFFESKRRNGREYVRQVARYPDWYGAITGIENKPDLGRPGDLESQLRTDVSLGLVDEAILATESYVTRAHVNRIPEAVGVWRVHREGEAVTEIEVVREPTTLAVDEPGIEPLAFHPGRTDVAVVSSARKARARRRLAERAYGKGWRTYEFPDCGACEPTAEAALPFCAWKGDIVDAAAECRPACGGYEPAAPADVDLAAERERWTPWLADPDGKRRRQSGLERFS
ncbi:DUF5787 family protein [Natrononativus amylolyticus]|uniref:DUF5787 family protein n=1 Tax=Natrononativus amylolyticus TaxID=2963434 RepID=UPI0020CF0D96|nr:DUF5787 family protein [Natrononativus amylolyticus]